MQSFAKSKFILSILFGTVRFISEPLRENKNYFLVSPRGQGISSFDVYEKLAFPLKLL
jgi:hypothetical protein